MALLVLQIKLFSQFTVDPDAVVTFGVGAQGDGFLDRVKDLNAGQIWILKRIELDLYPASFVGRLN